MTTLILDEHRVTVYDPPKELLQFLKFQEKVIEYDTKTRRNQVKKRVRRLYQELDRDTKQKVIQCYQGLWKRILNWLLTNGHMVNVEDTRQPFPEPDFSLMHGFRFSQRELLETALKEGHSGLIGAPTRYGKSWLILNALRAFPNVTAAVILPGDDLNWQLYDELRELLPEREIKKVGGRGKGISKYPSTDITVCSMDSMHKLDPGRVRLILVDEPHALPTDKRLTAFNEFTLARKYGFSATLSGRFDNRDVLVEGAIGPVLAKRTFKEGVAEGAICDIVVLMLRIPVNGNGINIRSQRKTLMNNLLLQNPLIASAAAQITKDTLPRDWQTLLFIENEDQIAFLLPYLGEQNPTIAMAKLLTDQERKQLNVDMKSGDIKRCLSSKIYEQGVTFHDLRAILNLKGGGPYTSAIQKPGRLAEIIPGKKCGVMIDFLLYDDGGSVTTPGNVFAAINEGRRRLEVYEEIGYQVHQANSVAELHGLFHQHCV